MHAADHAEAPATTHWLDALSPPIYLISILPGLGAWLLARPTGPDAWALLAATVGVVLLQHAVNVFNDVTDWQRGADVEKWSSWVRAHRENLALTRHHAQASLLAGALMGLLALGLVDRYWILLPALPLVGLGLLYNAGPRPLSYTAWAELVTGLCYGPGVFGGFWLVAGRPPDLTMALGALAFGCLSVALLLSHQPPQIATDRAAGKRSFAARHGAERTIAVARGLFVGFLLSGVLGFAAATAPLLAIADSLISVALIVLIWRDRPNPKRLLLSATALMLILVVLRVLFG